MDRYFKKLSYGSSYDSSNSRFGNSPTLLEDTRHTPYSPRKSRIDVSVLPSDSTDRLLNSNNDVNDCGDVRRAYIQRGPYQPRKHAYPQTILSRNAHRFSESWYDKYLVRI